MNGSRHCLRPPLSLTLGRLTLGRLALGRRALGYWLLGYWALGYWVLGYWALWISGIASSAMAQTPTGNASALGQSNAQATSADQPRAGRSSSDRVQRSVEKALAVIERSSAEYLKQRECFSCHHQSLPLVTLLDARRRGLKVDDQNLHAQVQRTLDHLKRGQADYVQGKGQGGGVDTAGYALLGLAHAGVPASETTDAVVEYLLQVHQGKRRWTCSSNRPPTEASDVTTSALALQALVHFTPSGQQARAQVRLEQCYQWLQQHTPKDTEELVFHLHALHTLKLALDNQTLPLSIDASQLQEQSRAVQRLLLDAQQADGGWGQTPADQSSDAYATGSALFALHRVGYPINEPAVARGIEYLLASQQEDGSWHVATRSKPIQKYFESGFPHGLDQFISISATCWSALALQQLLPIDQAALSAQAELPWKTGAGDDVQDLAILEHKPPANTEPTSEQLEFFEREIRPVLIESCASCHGADEQSGGLRVDSLASLLRGGESGPALIPGAPERSLIMKAVRRDDELKMPPEDPLAQIKVASLKRWIEMGAPWPKLASVEEFDKRRHAANQHWAFQLPRSAPLPQVRQTQWPENYIDSFVLEKLEAEQLPPHLPADRRQLLRRLSYDLTGLPPSYDQIQQFEEDTRPDALERVVDRLLASPKFGQHWGRHWLDVARYSDTKGYVYAREERFFVHAPAYRDWVVQSLSNDMPYNQFVRLQLAADQLAADDPQSQAAMGYLTLGRRFLGVTHDIIDDRIDVVSRGLLGLTVGCARCHDHKFDPIPTADYYSLYGVFLNSIERRTATTPWDNASPDLAGIDDQLKKLQAKYNEQLSAERQAADQRVSQRLSDYLLAQLEIDKYPAEGFDVVIQPDDLVPAQLRRLQAWLIDAELRNEPIFAAWRLYQALPAEAFAEGSAGVSQTIQELPRSQVNRLVARHFQQPPSSMREVAMRYGQLFSQLATLECADDQESEALTQLKELVSGANSPFRVPEEDIVSTEQFFPSRVTEALWKLQGEIDRYLINTPNAPVMATQLVDRSFIREPHIFRRGNPLQIAERVPRQFLSVLCSPDPPPPQAEMLGQSASMLPGHLDAQGRLPRQPFVSGSGRRELAEAIVDPRNPLTARVWTNRIWQHLFGQGLVVTTSDFGLRAQPPSHPELLDRMAIDFVVHDTSTKWIVRSIVTSKTYQQSSQPYVEVSSEQASAELVARFQTAAQRDPDNRWLWRGNSKRLTFEQLRDTWLAVSGQLDHRMGGRAQPLFSEVPHRRRTLYGLIDRQFLPGVLRVFDFANPDLHTPQRSETTVPQQALFGLNHELAASLAKELARRIDDHQRADASSGVTTMFRQVFAREPSRSELAQCLEFLDQPPGLVPTQPAQSRDWQYGFGKFNEATGQVDGFTVLPYFTGSAWQGGPKWPDAKLGWVQLTATGGHAGNDLEHAAVRRWVAPMAGTIAISSQVYHNTPAGDGVRAAILHHRASGGSATLANQVVHNQEIALHVAELQVNVGDTVDFLVDFNANLNNDQFVWAPTITHSQQGWSAERDFVGPTPNYLDPWQQLAQVLLLSNELAFVD